MGYYTKKYKKINDYSFLSVEELNKMNARGIELQAIVKNDLKNKDFKRAKEHSIELANIIKELKKYKKYAKKNSISN